MGTMAIVQTPGMTVHYLLMRIVSYYYNGKPQTPYRHGCEHSRPYQQFVADNSGLFHNPDYIHT